MLFKCILYVPGILPKYPMHIDRHYCHASHQCRCLQEALITEVEGFRQLHKLQNSRVLFFVNGKLIWFINTQFHKFKLLSTEDGDSFQFLSDRLSRNSLSKEICFFTGGSHDYNGSSQDAKRTCSRTGDIGKVFILAWTLKDI